MSAVFLFDTGGDLDVFVSEADAAGWMEFQDVLEGEYAAAYLHDGTVLRLSVVRWEVVVERTDVRDEAALRERLRAYERRLGHTGEVGDLLAYANERLRRDWERRWPRRPRWLARRLHGAQPPRAEP